MNDTRALWCGFLLGVWFALVLVAMHASGFRAGRTALLFSLDAERARRAPRKEHVAPEDDSANR